MTLEELLQRAGILALLLLIAALLTASFAAYYFDGGRPMPFIP